MGPEPDPSPEEPARLGLLAQRLEALLFATPDALGLAELGRLLADGEQPLPEQQVRAALDELVQALEQSGSALSVQELSGGYRLSTRAAHASTLQRLFNEEGGRGLTSAALETIAIVAYRQPVTRSEIEKVRGVGCGPILRALLDRRLIRIIGQQTGAVGRPHLYGTTPQFLEVFGLRDLNDLPELEARFDEAFEEAGRQPTPAAVDSPEPRDIIRPLLPRQPMHDTPLLEQHQTLGARIVEFAGWNMPVVYSSIVEEHHAVRRRAGLFDLSHMGRLELTGPSIRESLGRLVPTDLDRLAPGQAKYSFFLDEQGGFIDDILIYAREQDYYLVVNAGNRQAVLEWLEQRLDGEVTDLTFEQAMLAVQGPQAVALVERLAEQGAPSSIKYYAFGEATLFGVRVMLARTGYTGEDGFEIYLPAGEAARFWNGLLEAGAGEGLAPCGLGARDTLRLEAGMALYGHEIDRQTNPVEARLSWAVAWDKPEFLGKPAIEQTKRAGPERLLVGLVLDCKRVPREGQPVVHDLQPVGRVTSGTVSPTLDRRIAMAYVRADLAAPGTALFVDIRGHHEPAEVVKLPFYKRNR